MRYKGGDCVLPQKCPVKPGGSDPHGDQNNNRQRTKSIRCNPSVWAAYVAEGALKISGDRYFWVYALSMGPVMWVCVIMCFCSCLKRSRSSLCFTVVWKTVFGHLTFPRQSNINRSRVDDLQRAGLTDPTVFHRWKHCFTAEHSSTVFQKFLPVKFGGIFFCFTSLRVFYCFGFNFTE